MLSSQTKDETTFEAMNRLKEKTLTPISIQNIQVSELETLLHPVSFYKVCQVKKNYKHNFNTLPSLYRTRQST